MSSATASAGTPSTEETVGDKPLPRKSNAKGKGARSKQAQAFQYKKNQQTQALIQATMLRRLGINDPTQISTIQVQSAITPTVVPISLVGLPTLCKEVWDRMKAIGTRPFTALATETNFAIFVKCMLHLAEAKVSYAQMTCKNAPLYDLTSISAYSEVTLRTLKTLSSRLPYPLVIYLEAIGNFTIDGQSVVPQLAECQDDRLSGVVSLGLGRLVDVLDALREPVPLTHEVYTIAAVLTDRLPAFTWDYTLNADGERTAVKLTDDAYHFWSVRGITPPQRSTFLQIIASMESKKDFLLMCDIATGAGSSVQAVRFPEDHATTEDEVSYYINTTIPLFEEQLAPALLLGVDNSVVRRSRFMSTYHDCLKRGLALRLEALHALVWAE